MDFEYLLSVTGLGEFVDQDFFLAQIGLLGGSALLFLFSLVLCVLAFRAAGAAKSAREESEAYFQSAQDLASEVRSLTAQVEKTKSNERGAFPEAAQKGLAAAAVPTATMPDQAPDVHSNENDNGDNAEPDNVASNNEAREFSPKPSSSERAGNVLSFVDGDEDLLKDGAGKDLGFLGKGVPIDEDQVIDGEVSSLDEQGADDRSEKSGSPLSNLLRRRKN